MFVSIPFVLAIMGFVISIIEAEKETDKSPVPVFFEEEGDEEDDFVCSKRRTIGGEISPFSGLPGIGGVDVRGNPY
jgi:hypothetical protein